MPDAKKTFFYGRCSLIVFTIMVIISTSTNILASRDKIYVQYMELCLSVKGFAPRKKFELFCFHTFATNVASLVSCVARSDYLYNLGNHQILQNICWLQEIKFMSNIFKETITDDDDDDDRKC